MSANFKSHVLMRDEKGFLGVPFKRLLLAGVGGGLTYTLVNLALPGWSIPLAAVTGLLIVTLTGQRGGLPLWQRLIYRLRGSLMLIAAHRPQGLTGQMVHSLGLPVELVTLDGARVFAPPQPSHEIDMREWVTFARADEADRDDGLVFVDGPMTGAGV